MIFAKPPSWRWLPDRAAEERMYGAVHNIVLVRENQQSNNSRSVQVIIPSDLNMLLYSRFNIGVDDIVQLEVMREGDRWVMSFSANEEESIPMFYWTPHNKPNWV